MQRHCGRKKQNPLEKQRMFNGTGGRRTLESKAGIGWRNEQRLGLAGLGRDFGLLRESNEVP